MKKEKQELFKEKRWTEYQGVKILNINVKRTEEDNKNAKEFRKFIDKKLAKEK